ncbi:hypothetical protein [Roseomonas sp. USHLN139]|uniref:hypothetical protein n=1 Tax=Roseomonas sp. USHLN139 TaxID=3081298 RepID=UPI003B0204CD
MSTLRQAAGRVSARFASRFGHLNGLLAAKPRAEEAPATTEDVQEVADDLQDVQEDLDKVQDQLDDVEDDLDDLEAAPAEEAPPAEPPADKPAEAKAFRDGRKAGAMLERRRCAAIFASKAARTNPALAAHLAFETRQTAREAIGTLVNSASLAQPPRARQQAPAQPPRASLADRMRGQPQAAIGPGQPGGARGDEVDALASGVLASLGKVRGTQKKA